MNFSYWEKDTFLNESDVCIIGSGIVGLNAAIKLKQLNSKLNIKVLERGILPSGASTKNAGFACFGSLSELIEDVEDNGIDKMLELVEKRWLGLQIITSLLGKNKIDFYNLGGNEVFGSKDQEVFEKCSHFLQEFNLSLKPIFKDSEVFKIDNPKIELNGLKSFKHLIFNKFEAQVNTGKLMSELLKLAHSFDIQILNNIEVSQIEETDEFVNVITNNGITFKTKKLLFCTNGFTSRLLKDLEVYPARNQVITTKPITNLKLNGTFHYDRGYVYFRNIDNRILLGGGRNTNFAAETTTEMSTTEEIQTYLENFLAEHLLPKGTKLEIESRWSGILGVGPEKKPIINKHSDRIFTAVRLGGMGVAIGILVGQEGAELLYNNL
jgi:gamma-glutamylputrescine oxidase